MATVNLKKRLAALASGAFHRGVVCTCFYLILAHAQALITNWCNACSIYCNQEQLKSCEGTFNGGTPSAGTARGTKFGWVKSFKMRFVCDAILRLHLATLRHANCS